MAGNSWTAEAEKALLLSIATTANAGAGTKPEWAAVTRRMNRLGYNFTSAALAQRYGKSLAKPYNDRVNAAADVPITPASTPSRKRAAPGSGTRATRTSAAGGSGPAQAANEMASLALSADNGGDDAEPDMEDSKKRVKFTHGSASAGLDAGLNGQQIDLTGDDTGVNIENTAPAAGENGQPIDLADDQVEIKHEVEIRFLNASFSHRARARRPILVIPTLQAPSFYWRFCGSPSFTRKKSLLPGLLLPSTTSCLSLYPSPQTRHLYLLPSITTFRLSKLPSSTHKFLQSKFQPHFSFQFPQFNIYIIHNFLFKHPTLSKMDLTRKFHSMTLNPIPTNEEYFEVMGIIPQSPKVKIEKDVLAACEAGRKQLQEINAKKAADKEKARKAAEEKAAEAAAQAAANATAMDLD
ncbi:hypothetical protein BDP81DRAFT_469797 [Colletotrichum phormii]|uniref:Uncharacterized protein n=1 Tax=Colletotrichum phormii TaxID=359342 RepID=A0AAI9ZZJ1_9PEZI|nr:uncharacterized protein BDP81DRAFT_469797 [Colletotrichum phormii]KAK1639798.1 hypothetical protein BDP81DRAFT_469797 [Colletotrichum phormii]